MIFRQLWRLSSRSARELSNWLFRRFLQATRGQQRPQGTAGFVLPTVAMVMLVVILLTTAMVLRSLDRAKNASNFRVSQSVLNSSGAGIERVQAKIEALFDDPTLPRATPSETTLYNTIVTQPDKYTFGDEVALKIVSDFGNGSGTAAAGDGAIQSLDNATATELVHSETLNTAWRFPVDTDNNGKYDSFTLYGLYFRSPPFTGSLPARERSSIDARTPPMEEVATTGQCANAAGTSASLVGTTGWYRVNGELRKSFYAYAATIPITVDPNTIPLVNPGAGPGDPPIVIGDSTVTALYEEYPGGGKGFSALEFQQDQGQIPLQYQAVWYEDDLSLTPGPGLNLNGRVFTNSNLFVARACASCGGVTFYLISSPASCYFEEQNSKVVVGGNAVNGRGIAGSTASSSETVVFHRFREDLPVGTAPLSSQLAAGSQSVTDIPRVTAYNTEAYQQRIDLLARSAINWSGGSYDAAGDPSSDNDDPSDVQKRVKAIIEADNSLDPVDVRYDQMLLYFRNRTRRVPYREVAFGANSFAPVSVTITDGVAEPTDSVLLGTSDPETLRPIDTWVFPTASDGTTGTGYTGLTLNATPPLARPSVVETEKQDALDEEMYLGDRILIGNNLPPLWFNGTRFVGKLETLPLNGINWNNPDGSGGADPDLDLGFRSRLSRTQRLDDLGSTDRNGFWERSSMERPTQKLENKGGLRVVTGAGIYVADLNPASDIVGESSFPRGFSFLPQPQRDPNVDDPPQYASQPNIVSWPDTMPMWEDTDPDLAGPAIPDGVPERRPLETSTAPFFPDPPASYTTDLSTGGFNFDEDRGGDLLMRATAVYHYASGTEPSESRDRLPLACISSYYDPTTRDTARNYLPSSLDGVSGWDASDIDPLILPATISGTHGEHNRYISPSSSFTDLIGRARSNNGIVYPSPHTSENRADLMTAFGADLRVQARVIFPNGRIANEPLRTAMEHIDASDELTLADNAAIDTAICSIRILRNLRGIDAAFSPSTAPPIPHGAIYEQAFLDAQQIRAIHQDDDTDALDQTFSFNNGDLGVDDINGGYNLPIEERQPLEIRATVIDLAKLRTTSIPVTESDDAPYPVFLLPNSGIIYATRDDALPDRSAPGTGDTQLAASAVDFQLDPTRRPNAIMLINGERLDRDRSPSNDGNFYDEEKGLILATNLPVYIKGNFNLHQEAEDIGDILQEFDADLITPTWSNFYSRSVLSTNFACRRNQIGCTTGGIGGDLWRTATIVSDAITVLSNDFRFGFRAEGDYDLRNNAGGTRSFLGTTTTNNIADFDTYGTDFDDPAVVRRDNGFFANNFVTSRAFVEDPYRSLLTVPESTATVAVGVTLPAGTPVGTPPLDTYPGADTPFIDNPNVQGYKGSSYFNNFVTPVQRRSGFYEFVMEICRRPMVSLCTPNDWVVGYDVNGDGDLLDTVEENMLPSTPLPLSPGLPSPSNLAITLDLDGDGLITNTTTVLERDIKASVLPRTDPGYVVGNLGAGTTARPARVNFIDPNADENLTEQQYPRRVAFLRDVGAPTAPTATASTIQDRLLLAITGSDARPIHIGINGAQELDWYPFQDPDGGTNPILLPVNSANNQLDLTGTGIADSSTTPTPTPIGTVTLDTFNGFGGGTSGGNRPRYQPNALWYVTRQGANRRYDNNRWLYYHDYADPTTLGPISTDTWSTGTGWTVQASNDDVQPVLEPVTQLSVTTRTLPATPSTTTDSELEDASEGDNPTGGNCDNQSCYVLWTRWQQRATNSTFNMVAVAGQGPIRVNPGSDRNEDGGGLHNFVRTLENWGGRAPITNVTLEINGSFIQSKQNNFATGPFLTILNDDDIDASDEYLFIDRQGYKTDNNRIDGFDTGDEVLGALPYYNPPQRQFGFDIGLLTQPADLFAEQFTVEQAENPKEFLREVGRNDDWVHDLLCAAQASDRVGDSGATYNVYAVPGADQRPNDCLATSFYPANP